MTIFLKALVATAAAVVLAKQLRAWPPSQLGAGGQMVVCGSMLLGALILLSLMP